MTQRYGWKGSFEEFLKTNSDKILENLKLSEMNNFKKNSSFQQITAWENSLDILKQELQKVVANQPNTLQWSIIFEYELPREGGRRPDVLLLNNEVIIVIEFKDYDHILSSHKDQTLSYARDIKTYHSASHQMKVIPMLIATRWKGTSYNSKGIRIVLPKELANEINQLGSQSSGNIDLDSWIDSDYFPLPSIVQAARLIFKNKKLPQIKRAHSAGIPKTIEKLIEIVKKAEAENENHLALVTGVPGAGKTLVGLQFVYTIQDFNFSENVRAVFLSGTGPLVEVLKHALGKGSSSFVQPLHNFLKEYGGSSQKFPFENIWIYDEAQRAWDALRVQEKRGHGSSEPEDFIKIGDKKNSWSMIIGLIGEGQNIHLGEEGGIELWNSALQKSQKKWTIHCPEKLKQFFKSFQVETSDTLDLTISIRSHLAEDVHSWVSSLLESDVKKCAELAKKIKNEGFDMYITRDLQLAKSYVKERYLHQNEKRYGLLASSKAKILPNYAVYNDYQSTLRVKKGPWYNNPPESENSCCSLSSVQTEFGCQGLELDFPIVCWGEDLLWENNQWISRKARSRAKDPHTLRINSYRVLLSRGRDGLIIFVPKEDQMDKTYEILSTIGLEELTN